MWPDRYALDNPQVQDAAGQADAILRDGHAYRNAMIAELWATVAAGKQTTLDQRARCGLAAIYAGDSVGEAMNLMHRHGGSTSFQRESRLAECWRDLHVVGQTVTISPERYPFGGLVYLGMVPGPSLCYPLRQGGLAEGASTNRPFCAMPGDSLYEDTCVERFCGPK